MLDIHDTIWRVEKEVWSFLGNRDGDPRILFSFTKTRVDPRGFRFVEHLPLVTHHHCSKRHLRQLAGRRILDSVQAFSVAGRPAYYFGHVTGEVPRTPSRYRDIKQSVTD